MIIQKIKLFKIMNLFINQIKNFIIDSKIMKSIKLSEDKKILENELIRKILIDDYIKDLFKNEIDVKYIKDRIFNLLNREYISEIKENGKTYYKY